MQNVLMRLTFSLALLILATLVSAAPSFAGETDEKEPGPKSTGKVYQWKAGNGMAYEYFIPKDYDWDKGANLTLILHGSNLDRRWGFANHEAGKFRKDDIVVSPDGTTSNGSGGFNSLQGQKDLERMHALHEELLEIFKIHQTFLYGHSQGSFFSFYYAGAYPDFVHGVVGQASGVWIGTGQTKKHHHQAIVLMHGTKDPVVSYGQSVGGYESYLEAKYPLVRLRSLDEWNHWPAQYQTEQQLAWCEGMTTEDPERLAACFETIDKFKEAVDPVALYQVAERAVTFEGMPSKLVKAANDAMAEVEKVAKGHVTAIDKALGKKKGKKLEDKAWVGHIPRFLRHFQGTPTGDEFAEKWEKTLKKHAEAKSKGYSEFWRVYESKPVDAFDCGVELVGNAFLNDSIDNEELLGRLEDWYDDAKDLKLKRGQIKAYDQTVPVYRSALEKGKKAFAKAGKRFK